MKFENILSAFGELTLYTLILFLIIVTVEDLFIDAYASIKKKRPKQLTEANWLKMLAESEKKIAVIVANWREAGVIERMISGNLQRLQYQRVVFFIGVYPNDPETVAAAKTVAEQFPGQVQVVINSLPGPTSKGQMLNEIVARAFEWEQRQFLKTGRIDAIELFLMHDSEDIMHPRSLKVLNHESQYADFIQTPIFSFPRSLGEWVGSTYLDEFSELHTKDLLAREGLGAPVPSAGVGTCLSRHLVQKLIETNRGQFLREDSLTEDYVLGMTAHRFGFKTRFVCYHFKNAHNQREFIATREYFPSHFTAAIRQKSRWIIGIAFQSWGMIPWQGSWAHRLFLWRDRRGPITNLLSLLLTIVSVYLLLRLLQGSQPPKVMFSSLFKLMSVILSVGFLSRVIHRGWALQLIYGPNQLWQFPLRWCLGLVINVVASGRALLQFLRSRWTGQPLKWVKTTHVLPSDFGLVTVTTPLVTKSGPGASPSPVESNLAGL